MNTIPQQQKQNNAFFQVFALIHGPSPFPICFFLVALINFWIKSLLYRIDLGFCTFFFVLIMKNVHRVELLWSFSYIPKGKQKVKVFEENLGSFKRHKAFFFFSLFSIQIQCLFFVELQNPFVKLFYAIFLVDSSIQSGFSNLFLYFLIIHWLEKFYL